MTWPGVLLDAQLSLSNHIASVTRACYFHLPQIRQVKRSLTKNVYELWYRLKPRVLDLPYRNSVLIGLPDSTLQPLTKVLHTAA